MHNKKHDSVMDGTHTSYVGCRKFVSWKAEQLSWHRIFVSLLSLYIFFWHTKSFQILHELWTKTSFPFKIGGGYNCNKQITTHLHSGVWFSM